MLVSLKRKKPQITKRLFASGAANLDLAKRLSRESHEKKPRISQRVSGAASHWPFTACLLHRRQVRIDARIFARECIAGMAASRNCARGIARARLPSLACNFCRWISGERYHCGQCRPSLAVASGNTLEAVCGAWLVNRFASGTTVFDRPQGVFKFALAAMVSTIISPAFGVTSLALAGFADWTNYGAIWVTWWLGDTTGDLLIAPLIILWSIASKRRWNRRERSKWASSYCCCSSSAKRSLADGLQFRPRIIQSHSFAERL